MVLALALWQTVSDTFANKAASGGNVVSENTIAVHEQTDAYIAMPQLPYLPDAELAGMGGQLHSLTYSRIQRNTVFSISNKFIKTYYNYGNSNY